MSKINTEEAMINAMPNIKNVIKSLVAEGFAVSCIVISNRFWVRIFIEHTAKCDQLIQSGRAFYQYMAHEGDRLRYGIFMRGGCKVQWIVEEGRAR